VLLFLRIPLIFGSHTRSGDPFLLFLASFQVGLTVSFSGAYSVVYLGVEKATNKSYAVKVVDKKNTSARSMLSEIEVRLVHLKFWDTAKTTH
jgi:serine/threonine protein kinase